MDLMVPLQTGGETPLYEQIYEYIKKEIRSGGLRAAVRLPSTRRLAEHLKVSRSTTQLAYDQLLAEGYIEAVPCRGYFVCETEGLLEISPGMGILPGTEKEKRPERELSRTGEKAAMDFSPGGIDLDSFPYGIWRKISKDTLVDGNRAMLLAGDRQGELSLREAVRDYLHAARGMSCTAEQIVIGAGNEYLLMLLMGVLGRSRKIAMERPTYKQAYRVLAGQGAEVVPVEMDGRGMKTDDLERSGADTAYVMPSHQFPTGIVMPVRRRQELLKWACEKEGRFLIEDDYDSEFRYKGKPVPALQGMGREDKVIYLGTFSQSIAAAIRISYMVLPPSLVPVYREQAGFYASTVSRIDQNILYQFLVKGHFERHLNRMRAVYREKHDSLLTALRPLERDFLVSGEYAGLHLLLTHRRAPERELIRLAGEAGAKVYGLSSCFIGDPEKASGSRTVLLGYASLTKDEILQGADRLVRAWNGL